MKEHILQPEEILFAENLDDINLNTLKIYYRIFEEGYSEIVPPSIVIPKKYMNFEEFEEFYAKNPNVNYFLIDGHHKNLASALCRTPIKALEIEHDGDLDYIKRLVYRGVLFNWNIEGENLEDVRHNFVNHLYYNVRIKNFASLEETTRDFVFDKRNPSYMTKKYLTAFPSLG